MGAIVVFTVFFIPIAWLCIIWLVNRTAVLRGPSLRIAVTFWLSASSPLLAILAWLVIAGMRLSGSPFAGFADPKASAILLQIGLPASLPCLIVAYWGSKGQTA